VTKHDAVGPLQGTAGSAGFVAGHQILAMRGACAAHDRPIVAIGFVAKIARAVVGQVSPPVRPPAAAPEALGLGGHAGGGSNRRNREMAGARVCFYRYA
jgi:hypothetical protein